MLSRASRGGVPRLQPADREAQTPQPYCQRDRRLFPDAATRTLGRANMNSPIEEGSGRQDDRTTAIHPAAAIDDGGNGASLHNLYVGGFAFNYGETSLFR